MNYRSLILISFIAASFFNGKEVLRLNLRTQSEIPPPQLAPGKLGAYTAVPGSSEHRSEPYWVLTLVTPAPSESGATFEVRLTNISKQTQQLPTGSNGHLVIEKCPESKFQEARLSFSVNGNTSIASYHMYGCNALAKTVISVDPGDWITLTGSFSPQPRIDHTSLAVHFDLVTSHYYRIQEGWSVDKMAVLSLENQPQK